MPEYRPLRGPAMAYTPRFRPLLFRGAMIRYTRPETLDEAVHLLAEGSGSLLAGGTDFYPSLGDRPASGSVIDISRIREMKGVTATVDEIRIGGLTTWSELLASSLPRCYDGLKSAAREIGGIQIQNLG